MNLVFETKSGSRWLYSTTENTLKRLSPVPRQFTNVEIGQLTLGEFGEFEGDGQLITTGEVVNIWLSQTI